MNRTVYIDGNKLALAPAALLGQGGEAEVYDLADGRVLKWWKPADHPDFEQTNVVGGPATFAVPQQGGPAEVLDDLVPA